MKIYPPIRSIEFAEHPWPDIPHLVVKPLEDTDKSCWQALIALTENLAEFFLLHPSIDEEEPWFGWAFERSDGLISELTLIKSSIADPQLHVLIDTYVQRVIAYFQETEAEPGFYVHEEKEAGSDAILHLMYANPEKYFERFIEYLTAVDLEHTVAQADNIRLLKDALTVDQRNRLNEVLTRINGGEYMPGV